MTVLLYNVIFLTKEKEVQKLSVVFKDLNIYQAEVFQQQLFSLVISTTFNVH